MGSNPDDDFDRHTDLGDVPGFWQPVHRLPAPDDKDDRPWALCLWYKAPHGPFTPPTRYVKTYVDVQLQSPPTLNASTDGKPRSLQTGKPMGHNHHWYPEGKFIGDKSWEIFMRDYVRTVRGVDDAIGRLLDKLDKMRISENTLVIHTSDHGYFHGEFGLAALDV